MGLGAGQIALDVDFAAIQLASSQKPIVRLVQTVAQTGIAHNTNTAVNFTTEEIDTHGFHSTAVNVQRITPSVPGYYRFSGCVMFQNRTDWTLTLSFIRKNGVTNLPYPGRSPHNVPASYTIAEPCEAFVDMNGSSDYVELMAQGINTAAVAFNLAVAGSGVATTLHCEYLRSL